MAEEKSLQYLSLSHTICTKGVYYFYKQGMYLGEQRIIAAEKNLMFVLLFEFNQDHPLLSPLQCKDGGEF